MCFREGQSTDGKSDGTRGYAKSVGSYALADTTIIASSATLGMGDAQDPHERDKVTPGTVPIADFNCHRIEALELGIRHVITHTERRHQLNLNFMPYELR